MSESNKLLDRLIQRQNWGIALIFLGFIVLYLQGSFLSDTSDKWVRIALISFSGTVTIVGVIVLFIELSKNTKTTLEDNVYSSDLEHTIIQLSKNFDILRKQTSQGFTISSIFMTIGLLAIVIGIFGGIFNLSDNHKFISTAAGILMEFISGTALLLYRVNYRRLNQTSDKLLRTWIILTSFKKADEFEQTKKEELYTMLINKLIE